MDEVRPFRPDDYDLTKEEQVALDELLFHAPLGSEEGQGEQGQEGGPPPLATSASPPAPIPSSPPLEAVGLSLPPSPSEDFPSLVMPSPPRRRLGEHAQAFAAYVDACADDRIYKAGETTIEFATYPGPPNKCRGGGDPGFEVFDYENAAPPSGSEVVARFEAMGGGLFRIRFLQLRGDATKSVKTILWEVEQSNEATPSSSRTKETLTLLATKANADLQRYKIDAEERKHQREMEAQEKSLLVRNLETQLLTAQRDLTRIRDSGQSTKEQSLLVELLREQIRAAQAQAAAQAELVVKKESDAMTMFREIQAMQERMRSDEVARYQESMGQVMGALAQNNNAPPPPPPPPPDDSDKWTAMLSMMQQASQASMAQMTAMMTAMQQTQMMAQQQMAKQSADQMTLMLSLLAQEKKAATAPTPAIDPTYLAILTAQMNAAEARAAQMQTALFTTLQEKSHPVRPTDAVNDLVKTMEAVSKIQALAPHAPAMEIPEPAPAPAAGWLDSIGKVLQLANVGNIANAVATRIQAPASSPVLPASPVRPPRAVPPAPTAPPPAPAFVPRPAPLPPAPPPTFLPPAPPAPVTAAPPATVTLPPAPPPPPVTAAPPAPLPPAPPPPATRPPPPPPSALEKDNLTMFERLVSDAEAAFLSNLPPETFAANLLQSEDYTPFRGVLALVDKDTALSYLTTNSTPQSPLRSIRGKGWLKKAIDGVFGGRS